MTMAQAHAGSLAQALMPEFDHEMESTRKSLERVPADRLDWRPHPKSYTMKDLANHIALIPGWGATTLETDSFDFAPGGKPVPTPSGGTPAEIVDMFARHAAQMRAALEKTTDEALAQPWSLLENGKPMFTFPRFVALRGFVLNHLIHHRAQLGVYLRLCDIPVPSIYGPSADEGK